MSVTLTKCDNGCRNKGPEDFEGEFQSFGETVCDFCAGMWGHDGEWSKFPAFRRYRNR